MKFDQEQYVSTLYVATLPLFLKTTTLCHLSLQHVGNRAIELFIDNIDTITVSKDLFLLSFLI